MPTVPIPVTELDQWSGALADLSGDPYADPGQDSARLASEYVTVEALAREDVCRRIAVTFTGLGTIDFPASHWIPIAIAPGTIYPCAEWGGEGPKPPADRWYWSTAGDWIAVRADWEPAWFADTDPDKLAARPARWALPISETPPYGHVRYCRRDGREIRVAVENLKPAETLPHSRH